MTVKGEVSARGGITARGSPRLARRRDEAIAGLWGMAEAVVFFVIPDVYLTRVALHDGLRKGLRLALIAVLAAAVGGTISYVWGALDHQSGAAVMGVLPGIDRPMIEAVELEVAESGNVALLSGPRQGRPYKLYALAAGKLAAGLPSLLLITIPGRFGRFAVSTLVAAGLGSMLRKYLSRRAVDFIWSGFWAVVYLWFWTG